MPGIYEIKNAVNNKKYIGMSKNIKKRWQKHKNMLKKNKHINKHLQNAYNKYGKEFFKFSVLEKVSNVDVLVEKEAFYIKKYNTCDRKQGYNFINYDKNYKAITHDETKEKLSKLNTGKNNPMYGRKLSKAVRKKLAEFSTGENNSQSKLSKSQVMQIRTLFNLGKHSRKQLANEFSISYSTIKDIINRKTWVHI